jgi:type-1 restriction enzyme R protein
MVIPQSNRNIMIMRPYQVHAVEALMQMATETNNNAYV